MRWSRVRVGAVKGLICLLAVGGTVAESHRGPAQRVGAGQELYEDVNQGMVAYFPFDGGAMDASGHGNHGTVYGATPTLDRFGSPNRAYEFDGVDDYIHVMRSSSLDITGPLSLTAWVYVHQIPPGFTWISVVEKELDSRGYLLHIRQDNVFHARVDGSQIYSGIVENNEWHLVASSYDGVVLRSYIDGVEVGSAPEALPTLVAAKDLYIAMWWNLGRYFDGVIDDLRIYDRALSEDEIQQLWRASFSDGFESGDTSAWSNTIP